ncbi:site-2 protease family protein [Schlesneria paludicola]|uniref:site-2 protease family protein n=1 Tax=Schlesneria paludicola TaxID=360056 RepID=UPI00029B27FD|nr:site-2 protease family protein [Schlesneria paludicola]
MSQVPSKVLPWRMRPDLQSASLEFDGRLAWGIKDPLTLSYFEMSDEAFFVLNYLDGKQTDDDVCRSFHAHFRPRTLSVAELHGFLGQLVSQNLVIADAPGYGRSLVAKQKSKRSRQRWAMLSNILAVRFRGIDPDRFLTTLLRWCGWLFTAPVVALGLILICCAVTLVAVHFDELIARLPDAQAFVSLPNLVSLGALLAAVKVLHEFGHGLTCKRFGGECHEMGVMLLVFTPTLYCNVSDIWMIKDKWKRIAVSLAGIWIEAVIAAVCTFLWWFSAPGLFHSVCLNLVVLCGLSTALLNGNPLLRYDGYFALSDWLEIPNLQQQSISKLRVALTKTYCGFDVSEGAELSSRWQTGLFAYGIASLLYRVILTVAILWGLNRWLAPMGLGVLVTAFSVFLLGTMVLTPLMTTIRFLRAPANTSRIKWGRFCMRGIATLAALVVLLNLPLPSRVGAGALAEDSDVYRVYVTFSGTLIDAVRIGERVERDQVLARLDDPAIQVELTHLQGELNQQKARLDQLERRRVSEPNVAQSIPTVREVVRDLEQQLSQRQRDAERLVVRAPRAGTVLSATHQRPLAKSGSLSHALGSPLDERNRGCYLRTGTPLCSIGDDSSRAAVLMVNQDDINLVRVGQRVRLLWNELSGEIQGGEIIELAGFDLDTLSREAAIRLNLPARGTLTGSARPVGIWYQARVKLDQASTPLLHGAAGTAKILVEPQSLFRRLMRWFDQTFPI